MLKNFYSTQIGAIIYSTVLSEAVLRISGSPMFTTDMCKVRLTRLFSCIFILLSQEEAPGVLTAYMLDGGYSPA